MESPKLFGFAARGEVGAVTAWSRVNPNNWVALNMQISGRIRSEPPIVPFLSGQTVVASDH